ncbi:DUF1631 family protein [Marinagarivorans cellulosilyticus]|uniref:DUF1631 domain-containing protein n=1 Tax=Marinagarivorans cellulosilyticus TaxID=2721545 RepID=A0AAN2BIS1_9GAMM|nr:DUF1631 family protein [Marinagarivorans cellulosilyticus]BCD96212.1 hypothetical protein MARGE09_P0411 [Marinagarivorans cellulosilyticus]
MSSKSTLTSEKPVNLTVINRSAEKHTAYILSKLPKPVQTMKDQAIEWLLERLDIAISHVDDSLFELASHAFQQSEQDSYFFAMREIRSNHAAVKNQFKETLAQGFCACVEEPDEDDSIQVDTLSVIANDDMDEILAIEAVVKKGSMQNKTALEHLVRRLDAVCLSDGSIDTMPLSPRKICTAFKQATESLRLHVNARLVLFKVIEQDLIARLPEFYRQLNGVLAERGILPDIADASTQTKSKKSGSRLTKPADEGLMGAPVSLDDTQELNSAGLSPSTASTAAVTAPVGADTGTGKAAADASGQQALDDIAAQLNKLQAGLRNVTAATASHVQAPAGALNTPQLLDILSQVQAATTPAAHARPGSLMNAIAQASGGLAGALSLSPQRKTLQVVDGLFSSMLTEDSLANPLKELLCRLQIPIARAAVVDNDLLFHPDHSARKLVNALAQAGMALNADDSEALQADPLYKKMAEVVDSAVKDYDTDSQVFTDLLNDFETFTRRDQKRLEVLEKRILDAEEGRAKAETARVMVAQAIVDICENRDLRSAIHTFIHKAWHQVMFVVCVKHGADSELWADTVTTAAQLVDATQNLHSYVACEKSRLEYPALAAKIQQGFELIAFDPFEGEQLLKKLDDLFRSLKPVVEAENAGKQEQPSAAAAPLAPVQQADKNDASAFLKAKRQRVVAENSAAATIDEQFFAQAKALARGTWLDYKKRNAPVLRCRLAAVIESTSTYIFVNRSGQKVMEKSLLALAFAFKNNELTTVDSSFLFDKALERVIVSLRKSEEAAK